jgi:G3E family GTPase
VRAVNPSARLLWCSYGDVALPLVLDVDLPDPATQHGAAAALTHEVDSHLHPLTQEICVWCSLL